MSKIAPFTNYFDVCHTNFKTGKIMTEFEINQYLDKYHKIKLYRTITDKQTSIQKRTVEYYAKQGTAIIDKKTGFSTCEQNFLNRNFTKFLTGLRHSKQGINKTKLLLPCSKGKVQKKLF